MKKFGALLLFVLLNAAFLIAQSWTLSGPESRHSHTAVYDPATGQMIIFGGQETSTNADLNDVWLGMTSTDQNDQFNRLNPTGTAPAGRYGHVATYDPTSNRMMVFGGAEGMPSPCANDFWLLDGANGTGTASWVPETPSRTPPAPRVYAAAVYDPTTNSMIIFGGNNCSTGYFNDVWVLSSANGNGGTPTWHQLAPTGTAPAARESASAIYDSVNNIMTIYSGDAGGNGLGDVWTLAHANGAGGTPVWTQLNPSGTAPSARTGQIAAYDTAENRMIIFGGISNGGTLSDSWLLSSANGLGGTPSWSQLKTEGTSPSLSYGSGVYDQAANNLYSFAGSSTADKLSTNSHTFTLIDANGVTTTMDGPRWILGGPAVRYLQAAFYDGVTNSLFVFGGQHSLTNLNFNDYWQASTVIGSTNLKWTFLHPSGQTPSPRFGHTGLYDSTSDRLMVFGGGTGYPGPCVNDYHVLEHANLQGGSLTWLSVTPTGTAPSPRYLHSSAYDSVTNTLMIFGGSDCDTSYFNDVWILKNANDSKAVPEWTQLAPTGTPPTPRESSSAVYDPTSNTLIVFGGDAGTSSQFDEIWLLSHANGTGGTPAWSEMDPTGSGPQARSGQSAIYDSINNRMTVYGGFNGTQVLSDVWVLAGANGQTGSASWTKNLAGQPRRFSTSLYDSIPDDMINFGGQTNFSPLNPNSDIWVLTKANGLE